jgi:hypothetical protein
LLDPAFVEVDAGTEHGRSLTVAKP